MSAINYYFLSVHNNNWAPESVPLVQNPTHSTLKMRKIESQMNNAISNQTNWSNANTQVTTEGDISRVFLHGNQIATIGRNYVQLFDGGYQSNTTKSRLNAILAEHGVPGEYVFQKNFKWFVRTVQGVKASDKEGFVNAPFFSGMILH